jgi:hypothetical protein
MEQFFLQYGMGGALLYLIVVKGIPAFDRWVTAYNASKEKREKLKNDENMALTRILKKALDDGKEDRASITELGDKVDESYANIHESQQGQHDKLNTILETLLSIIRLLDEIHTLLLKFNTLKGDPQ